MCQGLLTKSSWPFYSSLTASDQYSLTRVSTLYFYLHSSPSNLHAASCSAGYHNNADSPATAVVRTSRLAATLLPIFYRVDSQEPLQAEFLEHDRSSIYQRGLLLTDRHSCDGQSATKRAGQASLVQQRPVCLLVSHILHNDVAISCLSCYSGSIVAIHLAILITLCLCDLFLVAQLFQPRAATVLWTQIALDCNRYILVGILASLTSHLAQLVSTPVHRIPA